MRRKMIALVLVFSMMFMCMSAQAADTTEGDVFYTLEAAEGENVTPRAVTSLNLGGLASGGYVYSSTSYYISNSDSKIKIDQVTWWAPTNDLVIGWYNTQTGNYYGSSVSGGNVSNLTITSSGVPDGLYKVYVMNYGTTTLESGTLIYNVK